MEASWLRPGAPPRGLTTLLDCIPNKRAALARALGTSGMIALVERLALARRPVLIVFTYHRIAEPATDPFYEPVISATADAFREQLDWLYSRFQLITLGELTAQLTGDIVWREPTVLLTFDDGYRDNFDIAVPILRERNAPATFFIPSLFVESPQLPWWDQIAYVIKHTKVDQLQLRYGQQGLQVPLTINLRSTPRSAAITLLIRAFLNGMIPDQAWFLDHLATEAETAVNQEQLGRILFMSWDQLRQLVLAGSRFSVGSHTHGHRKLSDLDDSTQRYELSKSKHLLEAHLASEVTALAYPYGWRGTYTSRTRELAAQVGYRLAFASHPGVNQYHSLDQYGIKRLSIGAADSVAMLRARTALQAAFGRSMV
jgi:peptidoglycan/xylan/chitin deacetylase (PgdA/CDA1 family)